MGTTLIIGLIGLWLWTPVGIAILLVAIYFAWFFRDPERAIHLDPNVFYAPADGTILYFDPEELKVAIRMSPFNVHINRAPQEGIIADIIHQPGSHKSVYFAGAEEKNEQNLIIIENDNAVMEILQITGAFARRLVSWVQKGEKVTQGQRIGMIKFGSQTNLLIKPKGNEKVELSQGLQVGQKVYAGISVIAVRRNNN